MADEPLDPEAVTEILDRIPGAYERTQEGRAQAEAGEVIHLDEDKRENPFRDPR